VKGENEMKEKRKIFANTYNLKKDDGTTVKMFLPKDYRIHKKTGQIINPDKPRDEKGNIIKKNKKQRRKERKKK
jgi:hypothetical protein